MCAAMGNMKVCPDPLESGRLYGYALDRNGRPTWADVVVAEERLGTTTTPIKKPRCKEDSSQQDTEIISEAGN